MGVYDRQIALALRLIAAKGETVTWRKYVDGMGGTDANPAAATNDDHTVKVVFLPSKLNALGTFLSMVGGTEVPSGALTGLMGQVNFTPELADVVVRASGEVLSIPDESGIEALDPNGEGVILYKLRFNR